MPSNCPFPPKWLVFFYDDFKIPFDRGLLEFVQKNASFCVLLGGKKPYSSSSEHPREGTVMHFFKKKSKRGRLYFRRRRVGLRRKLSGIHEYHQQNILSFCGLFAFPASHQLHGWGATNWLAWGHCCLGGVTAVVPSCRIPFPTGGGSGSAPTQAVPGTSTLTMTPTSRSRTAPGATGRSTMTTTWTTPGNGSFTPVAGALHTVWLASQSKKHCVQKHLNHQNRNTSGCRWHV